MKIYTAPLNDQKKYALISALELFPGWELVEISVPLYGDVIPLSKEETSRESYRKAQATWITEHPMENGDLIIGIQKGACIIDQDHPALIAAITILRVNENTTRESRTIFTEEILLPKEIKSLVVDDGLKLYEAFGKVLGEKIQTKEKSLYELLTGEKEEEWLKRLVIHSLQFFI